MEINGRLLKRYASCKDEDEIKKAEKVWLEKIEREYADSRLEKETGEEDVWAGGNMNRAIVDESDDDDDGDEEGEEEEEEGPDPRNPYDLPESDSDEEEMAELRRRVLASKPFANPAPTSDDADEKKQPERVARTEPRTEPPPRDDSDGKSEGDEDDGEDDEFDSFMNAQPTTDRTGINAKQRLKGQGAKVSATFTSAALKAPSRRS